MKNIVFIITSYLLCSCSMSVQNYYPDKINDTALYVGQVSYKDSYGNHLDYKDTVIVIRITNDSIAIVSLVILIDFNDISPMKYHSYQTFHIDSSKKYVYDDSVERRHDFTLFDFSNTSKLEINNRHKFNSTGTLRERQQYTFSGKRHFFR